MVQKWFGLSALLCLFVTVAQCQDCGLLPDGSSCPDNVPVTINYPDPEDCSSYYSCDFSDHCATRVKCHHDYLFDPATGSCESPDEVECGDRPCEDPEHCNSATTNEETTVTTTATANTNPTTTMCGVQKNCTGVQNGWYAEPTNCRAYWHCSDDETEKYYCQDNLLYDPVKVWCNYPEQVDCGDRPICDNCDTNCETPSTTTTTQECLPPDHMLDCSSLPDGWYGDEHNCRRYWQCVGGVGYYEMCPKDYLFDADKIWCNYPWDVTCGGRPVCDDCDQNCSSHPFD